ADLERPAGLLLHELRDVVAIVVRIDDENHRHDPDHDEPDQGSDDDAGNLERTHGSSGHPSPTPKVPRVGHWSPMRNGVTKRAALLAFPTASGWDETGL